MKNKGLSWNRIELIILSFSASCNKWLREWNTILLILELKWKHCLWRVDGYLEEPVFIFWNRQSIIKNRSLATIAESFGISFAQSRVVSFVFFLKSYLQKTNSRIKLFWYSGIFPTSHFPTPFTVENLHYTHIHMQIFIANVPGRVS